MALPKRSIDFLAGESVAIKRSVLLMEMRSLIGGFYRQVVVYWTPPLLSIRILTKNRHMIVQKERHFVPLPNER